MKLVTFQTMEALKELINKGYLEVDAKYIDAKKMGHTYDWVVEKMNEYVPNNIYKDKEGIKFNQFYKTFSWVPHMSIGKHLDECQMVEAFKYLVKNFVPMEAKVTRIGIAKTNPHRDIKIYEIKRNE